MRGEKMVLFITGECNMRCFYCPLSEGRRDREKSWANEREIGGVDEAIEEALSMRAKGAGITGGDPLLRMEETLEYSSSLKEELGSGFHLHLYTAQPVGKKGMEKISKSIDELRFHITERNRDRVWESIEEGSGLLDAGVEVPALPGEGKRLKRVAERVSSLGGFLNLNELEFSPTNREQLSGRGFRLKEEESYSAQGSEDTALQVLEHARENRLRVHYCTSSFKDSVQLKNRLLRTARHKARDYEEVTEEGLLLKGVILSPTKDQEQVMENLRERFSIPSNLIAYNPRKRRIETTMEVARTLATSYRRGHLSYYLVEEYPTSDALEVELLPL